MGKEGHHNNRQRSTQSIVTLKRQRRQTLRQHQQPSDYPTIKERCGYDRINVAEVRETSELQEPRRTERRHAKVAQKEAQ